MQALFFRALYALRVDDARRRAGLAPHPVTVPKVKIFKQCAARRRVLGHRRPLAAGAQDVHQAVHDFTDINAPLAAAMLGQRYQWRNMGPFFVRHVTRVTKLAAIIKSHGFLMSTSVLSFNER